MWPFSRPTKSAAAEALRAGDYESAVRQFRRLAKSSPDDPEILNDLGFALIAAGKPDEAVTPLREANGLREDAAHYNNLGRAHLMLGAFADSMSAFERSRTLNPDDPKPWYNITVCLREQGRMADSFQQLLDLCAAHPAHPGAHGDLALHYEQRGDLDEALAHLQQALDAESTYLPARLNIIGMLCNAGRQSDATVHLEALSQLHGMDVVVSAKDGQVEIVIDGRLFYSERPRP